MRKKEVNPFNIAFLDLLSCALAAVIILFVIVPKSDYQTSLFGEEITSLKDELQLLDSLFSMMSEEYAQEEMVVLVDIFGRLNQNVLELENQTEQMANRLEELKVHNNSLEKKLEVAEENLEELSEENRRLRSSRAQLVNQVKQKEESKSTSKAAEEKETPKPPKEVTRESTPQAGSGIGDFLLGMNPAFVVMISWEDDNNLVDLYLKTENRFTDSHNRSTSFGRWMRIPRRYNPTPHQVIIQNELVPGEYEIYAHLFRPREGTAKVNGIVAYQVEGATPRQVELKDVEIPSTAPPYKDGGGTLIGKVTLSESTMEFTPVK